MAQPIYYEAPEVIASLDPEALHPKIPVAIQTAETGSRIKRLGDMKASSFWLLLGLICLVVIGVTVGGAVGGSVAAGKKNHPVATVTQIQPIQISTTSINKPSTSATATPSSTTSQSTVATLTPSSDCIGSNGTIYESLLLNGGDGVVSSSAGLTFTKVRGTAQYGFNLAQVYVLSFEACIEVCASLNFAYQNQNCLGVAYNPGRVLQNCFAHNITTSNPSVGWDSAILVS